jgi:hypothetical protein
MPVAVNHVGFGVSFAVIGTSDPEHMTPDVKARKDLTDGQQ